MIITFLIIVIHKIKFCLEEPRNRFFFYGISNNYFKFAKNKLLCTDYLKVKKELFSVH